MRNKKETIVALIAADEEWKIIKESFNPAELLFTSPFGECFYHEFDRKYGKTTIVFFQTGCGKIPAAAATQFVYDKWQPSFIINPGTCGGFKGKVKMGDILLVAKTVVYDVYERSGHHDEQIAKYMTDLDLSWLKKPYPLNVQPATVATADQDLDPKSIVYLDNKYRAAAADWESGAIAYVANKNNMSRCLILRGISDVVDPSNGKPSSDRAIRKGTKTVMKKLIESLPEWLSMADLQIESRGYKGK